MGPKRLLLLFLTVALVAGGGYWALRPDAARPIVVGVLHSLTGSMAASEAPVVDGVLLAVTLEVGRAGERLTFRVSDTGIGMTPAQVAKLFQAFTQADASTTRKYGGTGLGLTITRRFCEMMGGDIQVQSEVNRGTTITVELPVEVAERRAAARPAAEAPSPVPVGPTGSQRSAM